MTAVSPVDKPESSVPDTLYKYFPPERIDVLLNMELRFSPPTEFNDTFDTQFLVPRNQGSRAKVARSLLRTRVGVLCLTERADNHLMWVHYAQDHTGFILGFNAKSPFFSDDTRTLGKVSYRSGPRVLQQVDEGACFYKSKTWRYEEEWRCVRSFGASESRVVGIEPGLVTQIILGYQMQPWQIARIMLYATAHEMTPHTQFLQSTPLSKTWTFENRPKTMSFCENCDGDGYVMRDSKDTGK
jgi:hypothetical protein